MATTAPSRPRSRTSARFVSPQMIRFGLVGLTGIIVNQLIFSASVDVAAIGIPLAAFIATTLAVMILRRVMPDLPRPFRTPAIWLVGPAGILGCVYLFTSLSPRTMLFFAAWNVVGVVVYLLYGRTRSRLATA